jgi:hypothetical protein
MVDEFKNLGELIAAVCNALAGGDIDPRLRIGTPPNLTELARLRRLLDLFADTLEQKEKHHAPHHPRQAHLAPR